MLSLLFLVLDINSENPLISSNPFSNATNDHIQNAQLAAAASFIYATHHPHSAYVSQPPPPTTASPYATIAAYPPAPAPPTIIPPPTQPLSLAQIIPNHITDIQQQSHQAPILTSPKHETSSTKNSVQQSTVQKTTTTAPTKPLTTTANGVNIDTLKATTNPIHITDLLSSSPSIPNSQQQPPPSLLSPITVQANNPNKAPATSLNDIWPYTATGSPLNLSQTAAQTAAQTAVAAMSLLNNENSQNTEIANEILKELTTPTKQNM